LLGNVLILIGVLIFDLTKKYILCFFLLIYLANYINFLGFNQLIRMLNTGESEVESLKKRTNCYFYTMNFLYAANLVLACFEYFGPFCSQNNLYPKCLTSAAALYVINYGYHRYLHGNHYFLKWGALKDLENPIL